MCRTLAESVVLSMMGQSILRLLALSLLVQPLNAGPIAAKALKFHPPAEKRLQSTQEALDAHRGLLLVDGNNVRAATGFRFSASEMNSCLDEWGARSGCSSQLAIFWDHGDTATSFQLPSSTTVFMSGPSQSADDVMVQACGFLASGKDDIIVVTSDQALRGRCRTQLLEAAAACKIELKTLHAVYLTWMLEMDQVLGWRGTDELRARYSTPHRCQTETTANRAEQAQLLLGALSQSASTTFNGQEANPVVMLAKWYHAGSDGLGVARASRRGNPIYSFHHTSGLDTQSLLN